MLEPLLSDLSSRPPRLAAIPGLPEAAVALIVTADPDRLLLIRRAERSGDPWSGHLALPGGRRAAADTDLIDTAIRETGEETGVTIERDWCRAQLDDLAPQTPTLPPIMVRPFVFVSPRAAPPSLGGEVVLADWLPFSRLATPGAYTLRTIEVRGAPRTVPGYVLDEGFLWGMTERILSPVVERWKRLAGG